MSKFHGWKIWVFIFAFLLALVNCGGGGSSTAAVEAEEKTEEDTDPVATLTTACVDEDGDGFTVEVSVDSSDNDTMALVTVNCALVDDCDDTDDGIFPGAIETIGDGIDQNCDNSDSAATGDTDDDGIEDDHDNCPYASNASQVNSDGDDYGDACDAFPDDADEWLDGDGDGIGNNADVCPALSDAAAQTDSDGDGYGDACDAFPSDVGEAFDSDGDGIGDASDLCPTDSDPDQYDTDDDGQGNECDSDDDGDGVSDDEDSCQLTTNSGNDFDNDGVDNNCDPDECTEDHSCEDDDGDGISIFEDVCDGMYDPDNHDSDGDGVCDSYDSTDCDADEESTYYADSDGDGYGDAATSVSSCSASSGYVADNTDCDTNDADVNPGATNACNDCNIETTCSLYGTFALSGIGTNIDGAIFFVGSNDEKFGSSIATPGDYNDDGYDDLLIGASGYSSDMGAAYLLSGADLSDVEYDLADCGTTVTPCIKFTGTASSDYAGASVTFSDLNGDAYDDVTIGAYGYDDGSNSDVGVVNVISGGSLTFSSSDTAIGSYGKTFLGANSGDKFGYRVANVGNTNGISYMFSGYGDLVVGSYGYDNGSESSAGASTLIYGAWDRLTIYWPDDGDLTVDCSTLSFCAQFSGETSYDHANSAFPAGDLNDDGENDFLIGAIGYDNGSITGVGMAYLVNGSETEYSGISDIADEAAASFVGEDTSYSFGADAASLGDINGDSIDDAIVAASGSALAVLFGSSSTCGSTAYVIPGSAGGYSGSESLTDTAIRFTPETDTDCGGFSVAGAGDVNGDGLNDILIGAPLYSDGDNEYVGAAYLFYGSSDLEGTINLADADAKFIGTTAYDFAGQTVQGVGDINDDGYDDIAITRMDVFADGEDAGAVYLIYGHGE
jgi:hypothetical protein